MKNISRYDTKKFIFNYFKFQLPLSLYIIACEIIRQQMKHMFIL